jgi:hypothetical protein
MNVSSPPLLPRPAASLPSPYRARRTKHSWLSLLPSFIAPNIFALLASVILIEATDRVSYGLVLYCSLVSVIMAIHHRPLSPGERGEKPRTPNRPARIKRARPKP